MKQVLRFAAQLALYAPLMALIGYFSTAPRFSPIGPGEALLRLSFIHAAQTKAPCRERSAAELEKLAPNMRAPLDCPRERAVMLVELELDGDVLLRRELSPAGLRRDGNATVYYRLPLPAGRHRVVARLRDRPEGDFNYVHEETVDLGAGRVMLIDFVPDQGGFVFRK